MEFASLCPRHVPELKLQLAYTCPSSHLKYCADAEKMQLCGCQGVKYVDFGCPAAEPCSDTVRSSTGAETASLHLCELQPPPRITGQASELQGILLQRCEGLPVLCMYPWLPAHRRAEIMVQAFTAFRVQPVQSVVICFKPAHHLSKERFGSPHLSAPPCLQSPLSCL